MSDANSQAINEPSDLVEIYFSSLFQFFRQFYDVVKLHYLFLQIHPVGFDRERQPSWSCSLSQGHPEWIGPVFCDVNLNDWEQLSLLF